MEARNELLRRDLEQLRKEAEAARGEAAAARAEAAREREVARAAGEELAPARRGWEEERGRLTRLMDWAVGQKATGAPPPHPPSPGSTQ